MKISRQMNLDALRNEIGSGALKEDAVAMRKLLVGDFNGMDTTDISDYQWNALFIDMEYPAFLGKKEK